RDAIDMGLARLGARVDPHLAALLVDVDHLAVAEARRRERPDELSVRVTELELPAALSLGAPEELCSTVDPARYAGIEVDPRVVVLGEELARPAARVIDRDQRLVVLIAALNQRRERSGPG